MEINRRTRKIIILSIIVIILAGAIYVFMTSRSLSKEKIISSIVSNISESDNINIFFNVDIDIMATSDEFDDNILLKDNSSVLIDDNSLIREHRLHSYNSILESGSTDELNYYDCNRYTKYMQGDRYDEKNTHSFNDIRSYMQNDLYYIFADEDTSISEDDGHYIFSCTLENNEAKKIMYHLSAGDYNLLNTYFPEDNCSIDTKIIIDMDTFRIISIDFNIDRMLDNYMKKNDFYHDCHYDIEKALYVIGFEYNTDDEIKIPK